MWSPDPLFTVRVASEGSAIAGVLQTLLTGGISLAAVWWGGRMARDSTAGGEQRQAKAKARSAALAVKAEAIAALVTVAKLDALMAQHTATAELDAYELFKYGAVFDDPAPAASAVAKDPGMLHEDVAIAIATYLAAIRTYRQLLVVLHKMAADDAPLARLKEKLIQGQPMMVMVREGADAVVKAIDLHYLALKT